MPDILCSINDAARILKLGRTSIYRLIKQGRLKKVKLNNSTRVTIESVAELIRTSEVTK